MVASRQSLTGWVPAHANRIPCSDAARWTSPIVLVRSSLASDTVLQMPVTTSRVDCISSWRICGCSPVSPITGSSASSLPASCRSIRLSASMSCTSHSTPSVAPREGFHSIAMTDLRARNCLQFAGLVFAPYLTQRVADLAQGRVRAERVPERIKHVVRAFRGFLEGTDRAAERGLVPLFLEPGQLRGLFGFNGRVEAQRLIGLFAGRGEFVHAYDNTVAVVDLPRDLIGGILDLRLLEAALDGRHRAAQVFDLSHELLRGGLDVVGHRLDRVGAREGVHGGGQVALVRDHLLG